MQHTELQPSSTCMIQTATLSPTLKSTSLKAHRCDWMLCLAVAKGIAIHALADLAARITPS